MTTKEKRLLTIAVVMFIGYMLPFYVLPYARNFYGDYWDSLDKARQEIERRSGLMGRVEHWEAENKRAKQEQKQIENGLLPGNTRELVGAKMQELVRQLAQTAGIKFKSLDMPDASLSTGEWVLVIQSMLFEANSKTLMKFLRAVDNAKVNLVIVSLDIRTNRNKLSCTIKITGFSRVSVENDES